MPWTAADAVRHTKQANTAKKRRQWRAVANSALKRGASEGSAIRQANAVVSRGRGGLEFAMGGMVPKPGKAKKAQPRTDEILEYKNPKELLPKSDDEPDMPLLPKEESEILERQQRLRFLRKRAPVSMARGGLVGMPMMAKGRRVMPDQAMKKREKDMPMDLGQARMMMRGR